MTQQNADSIIIFDRQRVRRNRNRAATFFHDHDFLFRTSAAMLADRLRDVKRDFPLAADLGCHTGQTAEAIEGLNGIETLIGTDLSPDMVRHAAENNALAPIVADEEFLPLAPGSLDLVLTNLSLHWVNDLPGTLLQIRQALKPDGLFLGCMLGGETLKELRRVLTETEIALHGGASPHVSPMAELGDASALLQRAGFALPVADIDTVTVTYPDLFRLAHDLRRMGEGNAVAARSGKNPGKRFFMEAAQRYQQLFGGPDGRIEATFQILFLIGWAPHESQPKPLKPGSARTRLADALGTDEIPAGVATGRAKDREDESEH